MDQNFESITMEIFKPEASTEEYYHNNLLKSVMNDSLNSDMNTIYQALQNAQSQSLGYTFRFVISLLILKSSKEAPLEDGLGIQHFQYIKFFLISYPGYQNQIWDAYSAGLSREILNSDKSALIKWAKDLNSYLNVSSLSDCFKLLKCRLVKYIYEDFRKLSSRFAPEIADEVLDIVYYIHYYDTTQVILVNIAVEIVNKDLTNYYNIESIRQSANMEAITEELKTIVIKSKMFLDLLNEENKNNCMLLCKYLVTEGIKPVGFVPDQIDRRNSYPTGTNNKNQNIYMDIPPEQLSDPEIDLTGYVQERHPIYTKYLVNLTVLVYRASIPTNKLIVKYYQNYKEYKEFIYREIKILTGLSNRRQFYPLLLRYFGSWFNDDYYALCMEDGGISLTDYLHKKRTERVNINETLIERWIKELIKTFYWLSQQGIIHRDIKPCNILVNEQSLEIKIIDFSVSDQLDEPVNSYDSVGSPTIQGTPGYLAPELNIKMKINQRSGNYNYAKADVFSLGLTIYQMITLKENEKWNKPKNNKKLLSDIDSINAKDWVKSLLKEMLKLDPDERASFRTCFTFFENNVASSYLPY